MPADNDVLFRLVRDDRAVEVSFKSRLLSGRGRLPEGPVMLHSGVSMFETADMAAARGGKYESWVARVKLPPEQPIHVAKTLGVGHYTVRADSRVLAELAEETGVWVRLEKR